MDQLHDKGYTEEFDQTLEIEPLVKEEEERSAVITLRCGCACGLDRPGT